MTTPFALIESALATVGADVRRLANALGIDLELQPLLPAIDLSATATWPGGSITAAAGPGEPIAALCLPAGAVWSGGGCALWDAAIIEFDAAMRVSAIDITAPSADARPDIIGLDYAASPDGPWTPLLTHDVGSITATQRVNFAATTARCWRVSVVADAASTPAIFAIQLYGIQL